MEKNISSRLEEAKKLFDRALKKAIKSVREAKEELSRPLNHDEIFERDFTHLSDQKGPKEKKS